MKNRSANIGLLISIITLFFILSPYAYAQVDEINLLLKCQSFGDFHQATKIKKYGKESLKIWEPQLSYIKMIMPDFFTVSGGVEKLDMKYDEVWIYQDTESFTPSEKKKYKGTFNTTKMFWYRNQIQGCIVEKWFIGNPLTGEKLQKPSLKIWNIYPRNYIIKKISEN